MVAVAAECRGTYGRKGSVGKHLDQLDDAGVSVPSHDGVRFAAQLEHIDIPEAVLLTAFVAVRRRPVGEERAVGEYADTLHAIVIRAHERLSVVAEVERDDCVRAFQIEYSPKQMVRSVHRVHRLHRAVCVYANQLDAFDVVASVARGHDCVLRVVHLEHGNVLRPGEQVKAAGAVDGRAGRHQRWARQPVHLYVSRAGKQAGKRSALRQHHVGRRAARAARDAPPVERNGILASMGQPGGLVAGLHGVQEHDLAAVAFDPRKARVSRRVGRHLQLRRAVDIHVLVEHDPYGDDLSRAVHAVKGRQLDPQHRRRGLLRVRLARMHCDGRHCQRDGRRRQ